MPAVETNENLLTQGVITCSDPRMMAAACCALLTASRHLKNRKARFFLLAIDCGPDSEAEIHRFAAERDFAIEIIHFVAPSFEGQTLGRWPASAIARLYMDELVPPDVDRLLYVDADILVEDAIDPLFGLDLMGLPFAAVEDVIMAFPERMRVRMERIGMRQKQRYFNSGVLLMDWPAFRRADILPQARAYFVEHSAQFACPDQDALNVVGEDQWLVLDPRWNAQTGFLAYVPRPAILHFTSGKKPWHGRSHWLHRHALRFYQTELANTAWHDFCVRQTIFSRIRSYLSYHLVGLTKWRKFRTVRHYVEAQRRANLP